MTMEPLGRLSIAVSENHRFGIDALLLADFAAPKARERVCDLGTGCGVLPLLFCQQPHPPAHVTGVELQPEAAALLAHSVREADLAARITVVTGDLRQPELLPQASFDRVTCNPPYFSPDSGHISRSEASRVARHEGVGCTLTDVVAAAQRLLRYGGSFCLCHRPERLCDVLTALHAAGLEPKRLTLVQKNEDSAPWLLLCEAKKGGRPGLTVTPAFVLYDRDGHPTARYNALYALYGNPARSSSGR